MQVAQQIVEVMTPEEIVKVARTSAAAHCWELLGIAAQQAKQGQPSLFNGILGFIKERSPLVMVDAGGVHVEKRGPTGVPDPPTGEGNIQ